MKAELQSRQQQELLSLRPVDQVAEDMNSLTVDSDDCDSGFKYQVREVSKAQKKKDKKREAGRRRQEACDAEDVSSLTECKTRETEKLAALIQPKNLSIHSIQSDGDCLYNSVKHQLSLLGIDVSVEDLRRKAAHHMRSHSESFRPFIPTDDDSDERFEKYCHSVETSKEWGGHLELQALSESLKYRVQIFQAEGPVIELGSQFEEKPVLLLSYHRHLYRLGEHYNSLVSK